MMLGWGTTASFGQTLTWNATSSNAGPVDGSGTWNAANANWWNGSANQTWTAGNTALFGNGGTPGTVTASGTLSAGGITFAPSTGSSGYTLTGGTLSMTSGASILLSGSSVIDSRLNGANLSISRRPGETTAATLSLGGTNAPTGTLTIGSDATVKVTGASGIGGASGVPVAVNSGGTLEFNVATTSSFNNTFSGAGTLVKSNLGRVTLTGGTSSIGGTTLNAGLLTVTPAAGATFALGTLTRSAGSGLNLQPGTGTITVASGTPLVNGLIGPWATFGTGTGLAYATQSSGTVAAASPTLVAATAASLPNDAAANVELTAATGTMPATVRANTIRYTGAAGTLTVGGSTSFTANSLMNAGTGTWTLGTSGTLTMGSSELVLASNTSQITFNGVGIRETTPGSSVTFISQGANLALGGVAGFTGDVNFSGGAQLFFNAHSGTINSINMDSGATSLSFGTSTGTPLEVAGSIRGPMPVSRTASATGTTTKLTGTNYYTGTTTINNGTFEITSLPSIGTPGSLGNPTTLNGTIVIGSTDKTGTLRYVGSGNSTTDRVVNLAGTTGGATLDASGVGALAFTSNFTATGAGVKTLTLTGTSTAANTIGGVIPDNSTVNTTSLTKTGAGRWILSGANSYTGPTSVSAGTLSVNGSLVSAVTVAGGATLGGVGGISAAVAGAGRIGPGNSPGILTATSITPGTLTFDFEFTAAGAPNYAAASASINDVLRLTDGTPFATSLASANVVNVYFDMATVGAGTFVGGFFTDQQTDFLASISGATFNYFVRDAGGGTTYNNQTYAPFTSPVTLSTIASGTANFASGSVTGQVTQFVVVPEPSGVALAAACGLATAALAAGRRLRRRPGRGPAA